MAFSAFQLSLRIRHEVMHAKQLFAFNLRPDILRFVNGRPWPARRLVFGGEWLRNLNHKACSRAWLSIPHTLNHSPTPSELLRLSLLHEPTNSTWYNGRHNLLESQ